MIDDRAIAIGAFSQQELIAYLVVTPEQEQTEGVQLNYLYVEPIWREQYVGLDLLEYTERFLFYEGYRTIRVRLMDAHIRQMEMYQLLREAQYIPIQEQNKLLVYRMEHLLKSERAKLLQKCDTQSKHIVRISTLLDERYLAFQKRMKQKGMDLSNLSFNWEYSFFLQTKSKELSGCVLMEDCGKNWLIKCVYLEHGKKTDFLVMLRELLYSLNYVNKHKKIMIAVKDDNYYELFTYFFPKYIEQMDIWDYRKKL